MNQTLLQKLKRIKLRDFFAVFMFLAALPIALFYRSIHTNLWLFSDCADEARDNGYWLFKYVNDFHPEQECAFALCPDSPDYSKVLQSGNVIPYGSYAHWVFYLSAENIISSHKASGPNAAVCYILERFNLVKGNKIFLQHGIIKDDISFLYYKYTHIRLFTCSVQRELNYVRQHYGYPLENIQLLGLCRFDQLYASKPQPHHIVIMPTWRKWLSLPTKGTSYRVLDSLFMESDYYKSWLHLINSEEFASVLKTNHLSVVFYLHREAQKYSHFFYSQNKYVEIGTFPEYDVQTLLKDAALLITDYSSVAMDFAYMDKPLIYYQFDYREFRCSHLEEGYFNYETDGFGPVCRTERELVSHFSHLLGNQLKDNPEYQRRRDCFFTLKDRDNCQRTYMKIKEL